MEGPPTKYNLNMETAICRLCNKSYANKGNTTNLHFHLDHDHKDLKDANNNSHGITKPKVQTQLTRTMYPGRLTQPKQDQVDNALLKLLVAKALPISLVKNTYFLEFTTLLDPRYKVPSQAVVMQSLNRKKDEMSVKLLADLKTASNMAITHDGWTSCATESFSAVTAHFIDNNWRLKSAVLQTKKVEGSHTADNIANGLKVVQAEWHLPTPTMVTDNAANEKKASEVLGWTRFGCYGHRINLVVKRSLEIPELSRILGKSRKLVTFFHQSTSVTDLFKEKQQLLLNATPSLIGHKLIMDVPTRWNSTLAMLDRLAEQTPVVMALVSEPKLSKSASNTIRTMCLTLEEHGVVQDLIQVLKPFEKATTLLCAQNSPTMNKVLPTLAKINKKLDEGSASTSSVVKKVVSKMKEELSNRTVSLCEDIPLFAAMLSPDTKDLPFMTLEEKEAAHLKLIEKAIAISNTNPVVIKQENEPSCSKEVEPHLPSLPAELEIKCEPLVQSDGTRCEGPPSKKMKLTDYDEWFDDVCFTGESKQLLENVVEQEVQRYLAHNRGNENKTLSLLQWWSENEIIYPRLAKLAKKYLAIPASSVPSERVFSLAGLVVEKKRSRLKPSMIDTLIFLKMNMEAYW